FSISFRRRRTIPRSSKSGAATTPTRTTWRNPTRSGSGSTCRAIRRLAAFCCVGSPIDDRQYRLVQSFKAPWTSAAIPSTVGPSGALFVITYVELLQEGNVAQGQDELVDYGAATSSLNGARILGYSVLQQLDRPIAMLFWKSGIARRAPTPGR